MRVVKKIIKRTLLLVVALALLAAALVYGYIRTLPTGAPQFVSPAQLDNAQAPLIFSCQKNAALHVAYDVTVSIQSEINEQPVYDSRLRFKTQLSQANGDVVKGLASDIRINEGQGDMTLPDVLFLSRISAGNYALFTAFNDLGLMKKHPMAMLSQLLKALSVGETGNNYFFSYDPLQRTYRYRHHSEAGQLTVERAAFPTTANFTSLVNSFSDYQSDWQVTLGSGCLPQSLRSVERQALLAGAKQGFIRFTIEAQQLAPYADLSALNYQSSANSANRWNVAAVDGDSLGQPLVDEQQMWQILRKFNDNRDMAALRQAANYILDHFSAYQTAEALLQADLSDQLKRDLIFALGASGRPDAEGFMLETLDNLPANGGDAVDMQKVRMMVAVSSHSQLTSGAFDYFSRLANNPAESSNVKNNALINMGTSLSQLKQRQQHSDYMTSTLRAQVEQALSENNAQSASAILAAGNAGLSGLEPQMLQALDQGSAKQRYAAALVLSQQAQQRPALITHLQSEKSDQVTMAILANWQVDQLSQAERQQLAQIAAQAGGQKADLINTFLQ